MALTAQQLIAFKQELDSCTRPLFFFDDDADGLCSFLLLYRSVRKGHGVVVKSLPELGPTFLKKVDDYCPDKIFVLDKPKISDEFIDHTPAPIIMLDHHQPIANREKIKYFNPRLNNDADNRPTSYWCYKIVSQDLWIACVGCISDWFVPDFIGELKQNHPSITPRQKKPQTILFNSKLGHICKIFSFLLKGPTKEVYEHIKILTRLKTPEELLTGSTPEAQYLLKKFERINTEYEALLSTLKPPTDNIVVFSYSEKSMSFTSDLSNELLYRYPTKVIIVCRERNGEMRCSIRSSQHILPEKIQIALAGLHGYGGGHAHACGACIAAQDFPLFLQRLKDLLE